MNEITTYALAFLISFVLCAIITKILIPILIAKKMGQKILDIGPSWHKAKENTPSAGGIAFLITIFIVSIVLIPFLPRENTDILRLIFTIIMALLFGLVGMIDDLSKFSKKTNEGLTEAQKFLLQFIVASIYVAACAIFCNTGTHLFIPFINKSFALGWGYYVISVLLIVGVVNAVNFTDGIDGLATSVTAVVSTFFIVYAFAKNIFENIFLASAIAGICLGFLIFNKHKAKIFMGDTGSLFLGGAALGMAFLADNPLIILIIGIIYLIEVASVILQRTVYKMTNPHKRLFKMAPIHHHFEKCGWSENKIVIIFSSITLLAGILSYFFAIG